MLARGVGQRPWPGRQQLRQSALAASGEVLDATDCEQRGGGSLKNIAEAA
jgi:hypothetical protein